MMSKPLLCHKVSNDDTYEQDLIDYIRRFGVCSEWQSKLWNEDIETLSDLWNVLAYCFYGENIIWKKYRASRELTDTVYTFKHNYTFKSKLQWYYSQVQALNTKCHFRNKEFTNVHFQVALELTANVEPMIQSPDREFENFEQLLKCKSDKMVQFLPPKLPLLEHYLNLEIGT